MKPILYTTIVFTLTALLCTACNLYLLINQHSLTEALYLEVRITLIPVIFFSILFGPLIFHRAKNNIRDKGWEEGLLLFLVSHVGGLLIWAVSESKWGAGNISLSEFVGYSIIITLSLSFPSLFIKMLLGAISGKILFRFIRKMA